MAMPINKKAQNWRAARASGVKPGTRTMQDDGSLGGGTKLAGGPVKPKPRLPPLPPSPVSPNPDSPASGGASSGGREIASGGRNAGGPGSLPPIRPGGPVAISQTNDLRWLLKGGTLTSSSDAAPIGVQYSSFGSRNEPTGSSKK